MKSHASTFNPWAIEAQYGLDMACYLLHQRTPQSVYIGSEDPAIVVAAARRLRSWVNTFFVQNEAIAAVLATQHGLVVQVSTPAVVPDAACMLFPATLATPPPLAHSLVVVGHNGLSYRSLLYPGTVPHTAPGLMRWVRSRYLLEQRVGLLGPHCMGALAVAQLAGTRLAPLHFRAGQWAMDRVFTHKFFWWTGYVVILAGTATNRTHNP
ncbi:MAG: hypothetical protein MUD01_26085 [Chloroflexaceae bacterium]|jgi:hypothetical protein|nr:hypothetical protein [Chloroflexaceae bacterium]